MNMDDIKFAKIEKKKKKTQKKQKKMETLIQALRIYNHNIGMGFGIKICRACYEKWQTTSK